MSGLALASSLALLAMTCQPAQADEILHWDITVPMCPQYTQQMTGVCAAPAPTLHAVTICQPGPTIICINVPGTWLRKDAK